MDDFNIDYLGDSAADDYPENHPPANPIRIAPPTSQPDKIDQRPRAVSVDPAQAQTYSVRSSVAPYVPYVPAMGNTPSLEQFAYEDALISSAIILLGAVAGYHFESMVSSKIKASGYAAITGAILANSLRLGVSSYIASGDRKISGKAVLGGLIPLAPLAVGIAFKRPMRTTVAYTSGIAALGFIAFAMHKKKQQNGAT